MCVPSSTIFLDRVTDGGQWLGQQFSNGKLGLTKYLEKKYCPRILHWTVALLYSVWPQENPTILLFNIIHHHATFLLATAQFLCSAHFCLLIHSIIKLHN